MQDVSSRRRGRTDPRLSFAHPVGHERPKSGAPSANDRPAVSTRVPQSGGASRSTKARHVLPFHQGARPQLPAPTAACLLLRLHARPRCSRSTSFVLAALRALHVDRSRRDDRIGSYEATRPLIEYSCPQAQEARRALCKPASTQGIRFILTGPSTSAKGGEKGTSPSSKPTWAIEQLRIGRMPYAGEVRISADPSGPSCGGRRHFSARPASLDVALQRFGRASEGSVKPGN